MSGRYFISSLLALRKHPNQRTISQSKPAPFKPAGKIPPISVSCETWRSLDAPQAGPLAVPKHGPRIANRIGQIDQFGALGRIATTPRSCRQFVEQRLSIFQIERVEAFSEPAVDRTQ